MYVDSADRCRCLLCVCDCRFRALEGRNGIARGANPWSTCKPDIQALEGRQGCCRVGKRCDMCHPSGVQSSGGNLSPGVGTPDYCIPRFQRSDPCLPAGWKWQLKKRPVCQPKSRPADWGWGRRVVRDLGVRDLGTYIFFCMDVLPPLVVVPPPRPSQREGEGTLAIVVPSTHRCIYYST
jgi:hypothetical protein